VTIIITYYKLYFNITSISSSSAVCLLHVFSNKAYLGTKLNLKLLQTMATCSQPGSPRSRSGSAVSSKFGWSKPVMLAAGESGAVVAAAADMRDERPMVTGFSPCLDNVTIPYADDSTTGEEAPLAFIY